MELKTLQLALDSALDCSVCQGTTVSGFRFNSGSRELWKIVSVPASAIDLITSERPGEICVVEQRDGNAYEVAVDPSYLSELNDCQVGINVNYDPTQPHEREKLVFGIREANSRARARWLQHIVKVIYSKCRAEVKLAYRYHARSTGLQDELDREILIHDISASPTPVQRALAQSLVFLFLNLEADHTSEDTRICLQSNQNDLVESLKLGLQIPATRKRTTCESQITSLFRALLELSGGRVDLLQHNFAEHYTAKENSDLCARIFDMTRTNDFGEFDAMEMCGTLSKSPVFSRTAISDRDLDDWTTKMKDALHLGFRQGHLNLPSEVLRGFSVGQVNMFHAYLSHTYHTISQLRKPENNVLLLLTWSTSLSRQSEQNQSRQLDVLEDWASSEDGWNLYLRLTTEFQGHQCVEQLALTVAALMNYRRLHPDHLDDSNQPITSSYLADMNALLSGGLLGNSGKVAERMAFALARNLRSFGGTFADLDTFLETAIDREAPPLHVLDGFSDAYVRWRMDGLHHEAAIMRLRDSMNSSGIVAVFSPEVNINPLPVLDPDCYTLIQLHNAQGERLHDLLDKELALHEAPSLEELPDGSWEICVLKSRIFTLYGTIHKILPNSEVNCNYDPLEPSAEDLQNWDSSTATRLRRHWFEERAKRIAKEGWPSAAAYYTHRLEVLSGPEDRKRGRRRLSC